MTRNDRTTFLRTVLRQTTPRDASAGARPRPSPAESEAPQHRRGPDCRAAIVGALTLVTAVAFVAPGCIGYSTYPRAGGQVAPGGINTAAAEDVTVAALRWSLDRYPPPLNATAGPSSFVVALPPSVVARRALRIAGKIDAMPATEANLAAGTAIYRVGRVAIRGDDAEVDVYRPVFETATSSGEAAEPAYQLITITLRGGIRPWRVERTRPWALGAFEPPAFGIITMPETPGEDDDAGENSDA
ncbi:MAG: hypothetical protein AAF235_07135 [Planctomycetota bacterium]